MIQVEKLTDILGLSVVVINEYSNFDRKLSYLRRLIRESRLLTFDINHSIHLTQNTNLARKTCQSLRREK